MTQVRKKKEIAEKAEITTGSNKAVKEIARVIAMGSEKESQKTDKKSTTKDEAVLLSKKAGPLRRSTPLLLGIGLVVVLGGYSVYRSALTPRDASTGTTSSQKIQQSLSEQLILLNQRIDGLAQEQKVTQKMLQESALVYDEAKMPEAIQEIKGSLGQIEDSLLVKSHNPGETFVRFKRAVVQGRPYSVYLDYLKRVEDEGMSTILLEEYADVGLWKKTQLLQLMGERQLEESYTPLEEKTTWTSKMRRWIVSQVKVTPASSHDQKALMSAIHANDGGEITQFSADALEKPGLSQEDQEFWRRVQAYGQMRIALAQLDRKLMGE